MTDIYGSDAYAPREVAQRVAQVGVAKARLPLLPLALLGVLAGAFIGLGALGFAGLLLLASRDLKLGLIAVGGFALALLLFAALAVRGYSPARGMGSRAPSAAG